MRFGTQTSAAVPKPWRGVLRRHLIALLAIKFAALALLWALFFSPAHRAAVDGQGLARQLAVAPQQGADHD